MFSTDGGLFYGGGFRLLGVQLLGILAVGAWTAVTMTIVFFIIKKTIGLRVSEEEEIKGLDATEHNLPSAYADFMPALQWQKQVLLRCLQLFSLKFLFHQ